MCLGFGFGSGKLLVVLPLSTLHLDFNPFVGYMTSPDGAVPELTTRISPKC